MTMIQTHTGRLLDVLNFKPTDFCIDDVAQSLAMTPRWGGQAKDLYSVAQHCIDGARHVAEVLPDPSVILWMLLHDAHEAYLWDCPSPIKKHVAFVNPYNDGDPPTSFSIVAGRIDKAIMEAVPLRELTDKEMDIIHTVDRRQLRTEAEQLTAWTQWIQNGVSDVEPYDHPKLVCTPWQAAADAYLKMYNDLKLMADRNREHREEAASVSA